MTNKFELFFVTDTMDLAALNAISKIEHLPTEKVNNLQQGKPYLVSALRLVNTKLYGSKVIAELDEKIQIFLPKRVSDAFVKNEKLLSEMQDAANKLKLFVNYHGSTSLEFSVE